MKMASGNEGSRAAWTIVRKEYNQLHLILPPT